MKTYVCAFFLLAVLRPILFCPRGKGFLDHGFVCPPFHPRHTLSGSLRIATTEHTMRTFGSSITRLRTGRRFGAACRGPMGAMFVVSPVAGRPPNLESCFAGCPCRASDGHKPLGSIPPKHVLCSRASVRNWVHGHGNIKLEHELTIHSAHATTFANTPCCALRGAICRMRHSAWSA